jgi:predicted Zn-dependent peptidase
LNEPVRIHRLPNGLVLLAEPMDWLESVAFALLVPCGCAADPAGRLGLASFTSELVQRGCGERDSRRFVEDLELLGADYSSSVSHSHSSFGAAMPAENLARVLPLFADLVLRPRLPEDHLEAVRMTCLQDVRAVEDDVVQQVREEMRRRRYGEPLGRSNHGTAESIESITLRDVRRCFETGYRPGDGMLSVAGNFNWPALRDQVEELLGDWQPLDPPVLEVHPPELGHRHIQHDTNQTHIGVTFESVPYRHPDYYQARGAVGVLSDGSSSRLFMRIREERGLVYSVHASCHSLREQGAVFCYAGTSSERAQETLDVLLAELTRLTEGVQPDELDRLKAQIKTGLVLQQESSRARAAVIAGDWYHLEQVRTLDEVERIIGGLTCESINAYLAAHPPRDFSIVTLGNQQLELPLEVS